MSENWWSGTLPAWAAIPAGIASVLLGVSVSEAYGLGVLGDVGLTLLFMAVLGAVLDRTLDRLN
ncbi:hypothetical protein B4589_015130 [Halolamina sp. CBA1230]|uniref:hypothetical protein n=1 Tax=Halolamina sp. CBA1230 TaxID=1853690 RepID=UPI0009A19D5A|nr:hypothetical protein [Halolamina sp. CBA1230]QKY21642.1 hypothetical protein B4589_015130 [Halolamina sp. CBA1230]